MEVLDGFVGAVVKRLDLDRHARLARRQGGRGLADGGEVVRLRREGHCAPGERNVLVERRKLPVAVPQVDADPGLSAFLHRGVTTAVPERQRGKDPFVVRDRARAVKVAPAAVEPAVPHLVEPQDDRLVPFRLRVVDKRDRDGLARVPGSLLVDRQPAERQRAGGDRVVILARRRRAPPRVRIRHREVLLVRRLVERDLEGERVGALAGLGRGHRDGRQGVVVADGAADVDLLPVPGQHQVPGLVDFQAHCLVPLVEVVIGRYDNDRDLRIDEFLRS